MIINKSMIGMLTGKSVVSSSENTDQVSSIRSKLPEILLKKNSSDSSQAPLAGMFDLPPLDRYRFINNGHRSELNISGSAGNPEQAIKKANEILNRAILPPADDNPDASQLAQAQLIKRLAQNRLFDIAA